MSWRLQITAGRGPIEVRWFVARLAPALCAELAARGVVVDDLLWTGDPRAPASAELLLPGAARPPVDDLLGTHCEVRPSPRRGQRSRKRWFAGVSLHALPAAPPPLDPQTVRFSTCRAGGPGGQHVNTSDSAVRATHVPSGLSVRAEGERSQHANKRAALARLAGLLAARAEADQASAQARRRALHDRVERGRPVRQW